MSSGSCPQTSRAAESRGLCIFYTGGYLDGSVIGKGGHPYAKFAGFTLETQRFPNSPNLSHVPQARLDQGEVYHHVMEFRFFT